MRKRSVISNRKSQLNNAKSGASASGTSAEEDTIKLYLEQAEICCEQARQATRFHRFEAARGLFATAVALCRRALASVSNTSVPGSKGTLEAPQQVQQNLQHHLERISAEMAAHSLLARSMQRPMRVPVKIRADAPILPQSSTRSARRPS